MTSSRPRCCSRTSRTLPLSTESTPSTSRPTHRPGARSPSGSSRSAPKWKSNASRPWPEGPRHAGFRQRERERAEQGDTKKQSLRINTVQTPKRPLLFLLGRHRRLDGPLDGPGNSRHGHFRCPLCHHHARVHGELCGLHHAFPHRLPRLGADGVVERHYNWRGLNLFPVGCPLVVVRVLERKKGAARRRIARSTSSSSS
mmetsp:Transcript_9502/g.27019  ORF Transcript_9502/g.27019 Transcript_9502/m.27019 type:complete len:200 (+) Transcript_9502:379-978(+)